MTQTIGASVVLAVALLFQGAHTLKHGDLRPFFMESDGSRRVTPRLKPGFKYLVACLYVAPGILIFCVVTIALLESRTERLRQWLAVRAWAVLILSFIVGYGLVALARPDLVLRSVASTYSDAEWAEKPLARNFVRFLGALMIALSLFACGKL